MSIIKNILFVGAGSFLGGALRATQCKLLKGVGTGKVLRECSDCVADAAKFLEEQIGLKN